MSPPSRQYPLLPSDTPSFPDVLNPGEGGVFLEGSLEHTVERIAGAVERVVYHNPENAYCVVKLKVKGKRRLVTVVGFAAMVVPGEQVEAEGRYREHPSFGLRFEADRLRTLVPEAEVGAEKYLGSGLVPGIGPQFAKRMVSAFGAGVFDVIENAPELLRDVPGIGPARSRMIQQAWRESKAVRRIMDFLHSHGLNALKAVRVFKTLGADAVEKIEKDPFILAREIKGLGFLSSDRIARHLGIPLDSRLRVRAGLEEAMFESMRDGHCAVPLPKVLTRATRLLDVSEALCADVLNEAVADGHMVLVELSGEPCVYLRSLYEAERLVAVRLIGQHNSPPPWGAVDLERVAEWMDRATSPRLSGSQRDALKIVLGAKVSIVTGGPGTGKTTLLRALMRYFHALRVSFQLTAPTGRAARRLSETTGFEARTIHRLLGFDPIHGGFLYREENPLPLELVVIDEASMVDLVLMASVLSAMHPNAALILIGDTDQIPSVRAGEVFNAMTESGAFPVARLTEIFRQAEGSGIVRAARAINEGCLPELRAPAEGLAEFYFIAADGPAAAAESIRKLVTERIPERFGLDPRHQIQVLCPMNRGPIGASRLNVVLQKALNPNPFLKVDRFGSTFAAGDKILMTTNDYDRELFNGDIGVVRDLDPEGQKIYTDFDGFPHVFEFSDLDLLQLAYAITIHKAQGSEYDAVVIPVLHDNDIMLRRNLLYTAVTRARKLVVLVGQVSALRAAIQTGRQDRRLSGLTQRLRDAARVH